ncbi:MAG: Endonuclease/exonuclease/phosphatase [Sphingobacteriaceae bacterium]|jgi:endonuclease/exonuclease/phosphatase family metal-dependent hydrolase|nr:Endonuclease/exonuclease/phosphatase [Sphingobacteriaceae bacterium]
MGFIAKSLLIINIGLAVLLLLSYLASVVNPASFWPLAFLGLGYPFLLLVNFLFIVFWLVVDWKFALISLVTILVGWKTLTNSIGFRGPTAIAVAKSSDDFLRVLTYNVHFFKNFDGGDEYSPIYKDQILDLIRREQPDVLCIQEFLTQKTGGFNTQESLKEILNTRYQYFIASQDNNYEGIGLAIFSKFPIGKKEAIVFNNTSRGNEAIWADITFKNKPVRIYNVHLQSIGFEAQDYSYINEVKKVKPEKNLSAGLRILSRLKQAFVKRSEQVRQIKEHAAACKNPYVIAGDFNDTPASYSVSNMAKGLNNSFHEKGSGFGVTYNGEFPNFQIDYILSSPQFKVINYRILNKKLSDHYGVRSDLELTSAE